MVGQSDGFTDPHNRGELLIRICISGESHRISWVCNGFEMGTFCTAERTERNKVSQIAVS